MAHDPLGDRMWDVVVVGAGPAGSVAAAAAANAGAETLFLDRAKFPRYKTCGGGLIGPSLSAIPKDVNIPARDVVSAVSFSFRGQRARTRRSAAPLIQLVNRDEFDAALMESAVRSGAYFQDGVRVSGVHENGGCVQLITDRGIVEARAVVGADGSASRLGNHVGVDCDLVDLGLEVELAADQMENAWRGRVHLDWGPLPGSYGWVFPKGERLTVGVIARKGSPDATRAYLRSLIEQLGLEELKVVRESGHLTRCRTDTSPMSRGRVLVAGDAAGFLEPWTREGISFALRSGAAAGRTAASVAHAVDDEAVRAATDCYRVEMNGTLAREMAAGRECLRVYMQAPKVFHAALAYSNLGWRAFRKLVRGDTTLARILDRRAVRAALRLIAP